MPFIDWNNNGEVDTEDIAISIAMMDDEDKYEKEVLPENRKPGCGCLTSAVMILCFTVLFIATIHL